ncbi:hypothetical protein V495_04077 [Pseudogymnoascus sp. VKM F-4514 (FW-929)]|nr:hypothetical protein V495_04077 [Pseudogymnoascus sp. VKM F-4514 (FW-929)]KFY57849.1 hypothetical protein V497_05253 [Pseudogymnoascus sp. VKM F-4516 (FW-969)]
MAHLANGYARRVLSARFSNEYQEGPEEESWYGEYNVPFKPKSNQKRSGGDVFDNQGYPLKRPRQNLEAPYPYVKHEGIHPGINGNVNSHYSMHLSAPGMPSKHEQARYESPTAHLNMPQPMPYRQQGMQSNSIEQDPRLAPISDLALGNHASPHPSTQQRHHAPPQRHSPYSEFDFRQHGDRQRLAKPSGQDNSQVPFQQLNSQSSRASSVAPSQGRVDSYHAMGVASPRYQSVPPLPTAHQRSAQNAASGGGFSGHNPPPSVRGLHDSSQRVQSSPQGVQHVPQRVQPLLQRVYSSPQGVQHLPQGFQSFPTQARPNAMLPTDIQNQSNTIFAGEAIIQKRPVVKRNGPFIIDDDEDEIGYYKIPDPINTEASTNPATAPSTSAPQTSAPTINFAKGLRAGFSLTHGLDDPPNRKNGSDSRIQKNKSGVKGSKKADDAAWKKRQGEAVAYSKIKEKEDMAKKLKDTDALFEEPINEAAQERIKASNEKEKLHRLEMEAKKDAKQALAEKLENIKKEAVERQKAEKEAERVLKKSKAQEEREATQKIREAEEKSRQEEQRRKAGELLLQKRQEQRDREDAARDMELQAEIKRQHDAEILKQKLDDSKLAATSLKPAKKGQGGRTEDGAERPTKAAIETVDLPVENDGGLFVPEEVVVEPSGEPKLTDSNSVAQSGENVLHLTSTPTQKAQAPNTEQKASNIAATIREIPGSETLSLRAHAGWRGARKANTETKVASIVIEHHKEKLLEEQKMRDEALAKERARERIELKDELNTLFETFSCSMAEQVQGEVKTAVERVLKERPPPVPVNERIGFNPAREIAVPRKKYASETQCFLRRKAIKQPNEPTPAAEKSLCDSDARRREKEEIRLIEKAKKRFEVKLHRDNAEQSRPMTEYEFHSLIERQVKEYREKRVKKLEKEKRMKPHGGGSPQSQVRFGYEDIDFNDVASSRANKPNAQSDKGRSGGILARMRESNGSLAYFQQAAAAKIDDDGRNHLGDDPDSESEVSEEDPDDDDADTAPTKQSRPTELSDSQRSHLNIPEPEPNGTAANPGSFGFHSNGTQLIKPRHLQDNEMVYIYSVQRSEIRNHERSQPIIIKQFLNRDEANEFAEEELRRTRWGPTMPRPRISQYYSKETGLFSGKATVDSEENIKECVDVVAQAQYIGDLDDFEHEKVKVVFKPKVYFIFKSVTKKVQIPTDSDDEASESEEAEQNMDTDPNEEAEKNMEIDQNEESEPKVDTDQNEDTEQKLSTDRNKEAEPNMNTGQSEGAEPNMEMDEQSEDRKGRSPTEPGEGTIDALFEDEEDEEDDTGNNLAAIAHQQLSLEPPPGHEKKAEMTLTQTSKPLELYTDRELANKRASEIFLAEIRPVGGDITQLVAFQNEASTIVRERLESYNISGELFSASNEYGDDGEEVRVWVEDFQVTGPLN